MLELFLSDWEHVMVLSVDGGGKSHKYVKQYYTIFIVMLNL